MKITLKVNALVAALLLLISSCTQKPEGYAIKGTLKGVDSGTVRLIRHNSDRSVKTLDI
jgi:hypothetical protein